MTIQQMLLGSRIPLELSIQGNPTSSVQQDEPAPGELAMSTPTVTAVVTGATGTPAYSWAYVSGDASISVSSTTASTVSWSATVVKNTSKTAIWRCTVTVDGQVLTADVDPFMQYTSDI